MYEERIAGLGGRRESDVGLNMIDFFSRMNKPGSTLSAGIAAAGEALPGITARRKDLMAEELAATKGMSDLSLAERADMLGITKEAMALRERELDRDQRLEAARIGATPRDTDTDKNAALKLAFFTAPKEQGGLGLPNNAKTRAMARSEAIGEAGLAREKLEVTQDTALTNRIKGDFDMKALRTELYMADEKDKPAIRERMKKREAELRDEIKGGASATPPPPGGGKFSNTGAVVVQTPAGPINFPNKEAADAYRKAAGL
jgi:hypothetical protein